MTEPTAPREWTKRASDRGVLCWTALRLSQAWDFIDKRDIDAYIVGGLILWMSIRLGIWSMHFAETAERPGLEVAAILAAVLTPWAGLQAAALNFFFQHRRSD